MTCAETLTGPILTGGADSADLAAASAAYMIGPPPPVFSTIVLVPRIFTPIAVAAASAFERAVSYTHLTLPTNSRV